MRKLLQVVIAGLAAVSFSALAADGDKSSDTKVQGDTKASAGASTDIKTDKVDKKKAKKEEKRDTSGAGSTTTPMTKDEPAPAPAPEKKAD